MERHNSKFELIRNCLYCQSYRDQFKSIKMSYTIEDNLKSNYEKAMDEGRNILVKVCTLLLQVKGVTVAGYFATLSNTEKRKLGFNAVQITQIEAGLPLHKMDITLLHLITRALKLVGPGNLQDLLKKLKEERNDFAHQKQNLSLDKAKLRLKLAELEVLYTEILEELKTQCDPAVIPSLDKDIIDTVARLSILEKALDDLIHEKTELLLQEVDKTVLKTTQSSATLEQNNQTTMINLNHAVYKVKIDLNDIVSQTKADNDLAAANLQLQVNNSTDILNKEVSSLKKMLNQAAIAAEELKETLKSAKDLEKCENPIQSSQGQHSQPQQDHQLQKQQPNSMNQAQIIKDFLSNFVLITHKYKLVSPIVIIKESADLNGLTAEYYYSSDCPMWVCEIYVKGILLASTEGTSKKLAKEATAAEGLEYLKTHCHTLQILKQHIGEESITLDFVESVSAPNDASPEHNFIENFLKMMGCSIGAYSDNEREPAEPIRLEAVKGSQGLDMKAATVVTDQFKQSINKIIQKYVVSDKKEDLIFATDFTKDQRKEIRLIAYHMNLKGQSTGSGNERFLFISGKKHFDKSNIIQEVLKMGGKTDRYKVLKPGEPWDNDK